MFKTTLEQWRLFKAVADNGGFNQASDIIHKSQSTIHHAVRKLEQQLDVTLFEVQGRKALLTPAGQLMLRRASYLLDEVAKIESVATGLSIGVETSLNIAVDEIFPQNILHKVLSKVSTQYSMLCIELQETMLSGTNELIQQGKADIGLSPTPLYKGINDEICQVVFIALAHPQHTLHNLGRAISFEDLKSHRQIVIRDSAVAVNKDAGWLGADQRWTVSHMRTSIDLVSKGLGYAWLPEHATAELITQKLLAELPLDRGAKRSVRLYLNMLDSDKLGPAARSFINELRYQTRHMSVSDDSNLSND